MAPSPYRRPLMIACIEIWLVLSFDCRQIHSATNGTQCELLVTEEHTHTHTLTTVALENVNDTVLMLMQCWPYICPDAEIRWASVHRLVWSQCGAPYQCHTNTHFALSSHSMPLALVTLTLGGCRCVFDTLHLADFQSSGEH